MSSRSLLARKHRVPKGALRRLQVGPGVDFNESRQKAPSAKRCIKTDGHESPRRRCRSCQKATSTIRRIKTGLTLELSMNLRQVPESTERHKMHSKGAAHEFSCAAPFCLSRNPTASIGHPESVRLPTPTSAAGPRRRTRSVCRRSSARPSPWPPSASGSTNGHRP